jgi:hypothetical protein
MRRALCLLPLLLFVAALSASAQCSNTSIGGGWTCVVDASAYSASSVSSLSAGAFATNPSSGSVTLAYEVFNSGSVTCSTPTHTLSGTFTVVHTVVRYSSTGNGGCLYMAVNTSGGADTVTCKAASSVPNFLCDAINFSGNAASPLDKNCAATANSTTASGSNNEICSASFTPSLNGELIVADQSSNSGTITVGTGFTITNKSSFEYQYQTTAVAVTAQYTNGSSSVPYLVMGCTLEPAITARAMPPAVY